MHAAQRGRTVHVGVQQRCEALQQRKQKKQDEFIVLCGHGPDYKSIPDYRRAV
jgi:glyoxylase-like metal-dependent hydrolase (beta-lactamase superfamily II)